jgi:hypothetical protein
MPDGAETLAFSEEGSPTVDEGRMVIPPDSVVIVKDPSEDS